MKKILYLLILSALIVSLSACSSDEAQVAPESTQFDEDITPSDYVFAEEGDGTASLIRYDGEETEVAVPSEYNGAPVTSIAAFAFEGRGDITKVTLPESVAEIEPCAFAGCVSLAEIVLPESAVVISKESFADTPWYKGFEDGFVIINGTVLEYKGYVEGIASVVIPEGVKRIGERAFFGLEMKSVKIPDGVTSVGERSFGSCKSLMKISIPSTVTEIGYGAFHDTAWYNMQTGAVTVGDILVAYKSGGVSVSVPQNVKTVAGGAFLGCTAVVVKLPEGVEKICDYAFSGCTQIIRIDIPSSVTEIGSLAFDMCPTLKNITVNADNQNYSSANGELYDKDGKTLLCSPESKSEETGDEAQ